jgi:hypothetical protein
MKPRARKTQGLCARGKCGGSNLTCAKSTTCRKDRLYSCTQGSSEEQ